MDFQTAAALSASSLLLRIISVCDENGGVEKPLNTLNPMTSDPGIVIGMCGACGGTIEDYHKEFETMQGMEGGEFANSGSKALWDELSELREKEKLFDEMSLRIHELEEREATVQRLEDSIDSGGNKSELIMKAHLKEVEQVLKQREEILSDREAQMNEERMELQSLREKGDGDNSTIMNELRELKLKMNMENTQLQRQQQEHQEEREELLEELNQTRKQFEQLKKTHVNTNKKLTELKQRVLEKNVISNKNKQKSMENEMDAANTYSSLANVLPSNDKQEKNTQETNQTARERRADEALKKHADRLKAVRKGR